MSWGFQNGGHAHPSGGADGDQASALSPLLQELAEGADNASACCGKWMTYGQGAALDVHAAAVKAAKGGGPSQNVAAIILAFPGLEGAQDLGGKRFVNLVEVEVLQGQVGGLQQFTDRDGGRHQQPIATHEVHCRAAG